MPIRTELRLLALRMESILRYCVMLVLLMKNRQRLILPWALVLCTKSTCILWTIRRRWDLPHTLLAWMLNWRCSNPQPGGPSPGDVGRALNLELGVDTVCLLLWLHFGANNRPLGNWRIYHQWRLICVTRCSSSDTNSQRGSNCSRHHACG